MFDGRPRVRTKLGCDMAASHRANEEKKAELMAFLHEKVFNPILESPDASQRLKSGVRLTIIRMNECDPRGMVQYYWAVIRGTDRSIRFAEDMRREGFTRFEDEEILEEFRVRFGDRWLRS
jgi:hypothetical protein